MLPVNDIIIREATDLDSPAIASLMTQLGYPTAPAEMRARLISILSHADYHTFVTELQGMVVGMVGICLGILYEKNGLHGRLLALVVDERWRGQGIGETLVAQAEEWIRACGGSLVIVNSSSHRIEAHRFYLRLGYELTGVRLVKFLIEDKRHLK